MSAAIDAVSLASALAALLFFLSLWRPGTTPVPRHRHAATAGALILAAATLYAADVLNLPEIIAALIIGGAAGLLLGRELPVRFLPALMTALAGLVGLAAVVMALAAWINPYAFGLIGEAGDHRTARKVAALGIAVLTGALACVGGIAALVARRWRSDGRIMLASTAAMAGWSVAATAFLLENMGLAVAGGLAGSAGTVLAARLCADVSGKALADARRRP